MLFFPWTQGCLWVTPGISVCFGKLFKLDKYRGRQRKKANYYLLESRLRCVGGMRKAHCSLLGILMLCSQTTTRSTWLQKYLSTKDIFQTPLWGVRGTWLIKGPWGRAVSISDHCQVCQRWQITPFTDTQEIPLNVRYLSRCMVPSSTRGGEWQSKCGVPGWSLVHLGAPWLWS